MRGLLGLERPALVSAVEAVLHPRVISPVAWRGVALGVFIVSVRHLAASGYSEVACKHHVSAIVTR